MILIDSSSTSSIIGYIPKIRENYSEWHIITLKLNDSNKGDISNILNQFLDVYKKYDGFCYVENSELAISVIKLGVVDNYSDIQNRMQKNIEGSNCKVLAKKMSANGLKKIQINLSLGKENNNIDLFIEREKREKNVVLVAEDDLLFRTILNSLLQDVAEIHEVYEGDQVLEKYNKINPDIVILDIHLPKKNGFDIINDINNTDSSAFIIISSSDSIKENVLQAVKLGAIGFLAKPIQKDKLFFFLEQCTTFTDCHRNIAVDKKKSGSI